MYVQFIPILLWRNCHTRGKCCRLQTWGMVTRDQAQFYRLESIYSHLRVRVSPFSPEIYLSSETKLELDLKLGAWRHQNLKLKNRPPVKRLSQICLVLLPFSINLKIGFQALRLVRLVHICAFRTYFYVSKNDIF